MDTLRLVSSYSVFGYYQVITANVFRASSGHLLIYKGNSIASAPYRFTIKDQIKTRDDRYLTIIERPFLENGYRRVTQIGYDYESNLILVDTQNGSAEFDQWVNIYNDKGFLDEGRLRTQVKSHIWTCELMRPLTASGPIPLHLDQQTHVTFQQIHP